MEKEDKDLQDLIVNNLSRTTKTMAVKYVQDFPEKMDLLWHWLNTADDPLKWRSAWVFEEVCVLNQELLDKFKDRIAQLFPTLKHVPLRRMLGNILSKSEIPEDNESEILDASLAWLQDPEMPAAVRVHCMTIVYNLSKKYPELQQELKEILHYWYDTGSAGFRNRAGKILKKIG
jgi:hypothetical protein